MKFYLFSNLFPKQFINGKFLLFLCDKTLEVRREFPKELNGERALLRNAGAAAAPAARDKIDERMLRLFVHGVHKVPGMAVGHLHGLGRLRDGAVLHDPLEQHDPAVSQECPVGPVYPNATAKARR